MNKWLAGGGATVIVALVTALWNLSGETADTKRRVENVEKRQAEDRHETKADQKEIKQDVKEVKEQVQQIRILLERQSRERSRDGR